LNSLFVGDFDNDNIREILSYYVPREGDDLGWLGYFIGRNETLTSLSLSYLPGGREQVEKFFIGMQHNKIKDVEICGDDILNEGFSAMNFPHAATITLECDRPPERENANYFALGLRRCKSLKMYKGPATAEIVAGLSTLPALESMYVWVNGELAISRDECVALRELLSDTTQLKRLELSRHGGLGDDELEVLAEGLASNSSLTDGVLDLSDNNIGDRGVQALASSLASNGILRELRLSNKNIGDKGVESLAESLAHNRALRVLSISRNTAVTETGVRAISRILLSRTSGLEDLRINNLGDGGGKILADALSINKSLVSLSLLCVGGMSIGNVGLRALSVGLSRNSTLRELDLSGNAAITAAGLHYLKQYFRSPLCALETLSIVSINFGDKGAYALADALDQNKSLKRLLFSDERAITSKGWKAFLKLLCDTSSPNSIHLSNHTLIQLGGWWFTRAGSVRKSITTWLGKNNECDTRNLAAKTKIFHFFPDLDMMPLFQWNLKFLPLVKRWFNISSPNDEHTAIIRNRELTAIYKFVSGLPLLVVNDFKRYYLTQQLQRIRSKISELEEEELIALVFSKELKHVDLE